MPASSSSLHPPDGHLSQPQLPTGSRPQPAAGTASAEAGPSKALQPKLDVNSIVRVFDSHLFIDLDHLRSRVVVASKGSDGKVNWVTLVPEYHNMMVKTVLSLLSGLGAEISLPHVKEALFAFLLSILNGEPRSSFFDFKKIAATTNRANREKKRLSRKRARAAKRERAREEPKVARLPPRERECSKCNLKFTSRKTLSKHKCKPVGVEKKVDELRADAIREKKRIRRAKCRKAKKLAATAAKSVTLVPAAVEQETTKPPPVTGESGPSSAEKTAVCSVKHSECEDCSNTAVGIRRGQYPKCLLHTGVPYDFEAFPCECGHKALTYRELQDFEDLVESSGYKAALLSL